MLELRKKPLRLKEEKPVTWCFSEGAVPLQRVIEQERRLLMPLGPAEEMMATRVTTWGLA